MENIVISKITKVGTSLGIVLPVNVLSAYDLDRGDYIVFGFHSPTVIFLRKLTDTDLQNLKPRSSIPF